MIEALTPTGLWLNDTTAESIARACSPVFPNEDSRYVFRENVGGFLVQYDFDYCIPYAMERSLFIRESLCKEQVHTTELIHTIENMEVTPGNTDFSAMVIKGRRCQLITMVTPSGIQAENGLSLIKMATMSRKLIASLNNSQKEIIQGQVIDYMLFIKTTILPIGHTY